MVNKWLEYIYQNQFITLILITIIMFLLDVLTSKCYLNLANHITSIPDLYLIYSFLFLHHFIANILYFGFLSTNKTFLKIYVILVILVVFHWYTNNQKCILTQALNFVCGNENQHFHDILYYLGLKGSSKTDKITVSLLIFGVIIACYKIIN